MQLLSIGESPAKRKRRGTLIGVVVVGALAGAVGPASAQYYRYEDDGYGYGPAYGRSYGYGYREVYPDAPRPPRRVARVSARDYGLAEVDRTVRTEASTIVDGRRADGTRVRLIFDSYSGALLDRIVLQGTGRQATPPRVARVDPREDDRPQAQRIVPRPPERPASLKPPGQASAPATVLPAAPATPPAPTPGSADPATGAAKPALVNPQDVRGLGDAERKPPMAKAEPPAITVAPVQLPPVQIEDMTTAEPKPATPEVPVAPLD